MDQTELKKCSRHGYPPGEHDNYFNGECIWCLIEDHNSLTAAASNLLKKHKLGAVTEADVMWLETELKATK